MVEEMPKAMLALPNRLDEELDGEGGAKISKRSESTIPANSDDHHDSVLSESAVRFASQPFDRSKRWAADTCTEPLVDNVNDRTLLGGDRDAARVDLSCSQLNVEVRAMRHVGVSLEWLDWSRSRSRRQPCL